MATEQTQQPLSIGQRVERLNALDNFCQREIWCASSATRTRLQEVAEQESKEASQKKVLMEAKEHRVKKAQELFRLLDAADQEVVLGLRTNDGSITQAQVFDYYMRVFDVCFSRGPDAEEQQVLQVLAHQACTYFLPARIAARKVYCAHQRSPSRTDLPSFEDLQTLVRSQASVKKEGKQ